MECSETPQPPAEPGNEESSDIHRLMITKIVCENFKSYAGVKELGPFHKVSVIIERSIYIFRIIYT